MMNTGSKEKTNERKNIKTIFITMVYKHSGTHRSASAILLVWWNVDVFNLISEQLVLSRLPGRVFYFLVNGKSL